MNDLVNHPSHYCTGKYECLDVMEEVFGTERVKDFCLLNAFKYIYRCYGKNNTVQDLEKANFYINKWLSLNGGEKNGS